MTRRIAIALFILAIVTMLPPIGRALSAVILILGIAVRVPLTARGFWLLFGCPQPRYITRLLLPGLVLSDEETRTSGDNSGSDMLVLPQQNQENDEEPALIETAVLLISRHNLEAQQTAQLLAVLRDQDDRYYLSANQIRDIVGGADAKVKTWVRAMRPETQPAPQPSDPAGWTRNSDGYLVKSR